MGPIEFPVLIVAAGLVILGVTVLAMGHRQVVHTTPLIQVMSSYKADTSNITNAINAINALAAHRELATTAEV